MLCVSTQCPFTLAAERAIFNAELEYGTGNVQWVLKNQAMAAYNASKVMPDFVAVAIACQHVYNLDGAVTGFDVKMMWLPL